MDDNYMATYMLARYHSVRTEWIDKLGGSCAVCGDVENLEFDHVDPLTKEYEIAKVMTWSKKLVAAEMAKCQLLCKTHHIEKTSIENSVEHGLGVTGKKNCYCVLCAPLKRAYNAKFKKPKTTRLKTPAQHGERRMYTGKAKCRCELCTEAQRIYMQRYKK